MNSEALKEDGRVVLDYIGDFWDNIREYTPLHSVEPGMSLWLSQVFCACHIFCQLNSQHPFLVLLAFSSKYLASFNAGDM